MLFFLLSIVLFVCLLCRFSFLLGSGLVLRRTKESGNFHVPFCFVFFISHDRNPSNGSGFSDTGSMERPKPVQTAAATGSTGGATASATAGAAAQLPPGATDKRRKLEESSKESRIDAKQVIDDLIKSANLERGMDESAEGTEQNFKNWRSITNIYLILVSLSVSGLQLKDITKNAQQWEHNGRGPNGKVYGGIW